MSRIICRIWRLWLLACWRIDELVFDVRVGVRKRGILGSFIQSWMLIYVFCDSFRLVMIPKPRILTKGSVPCPYAPFV